MPCSGLGRFQGTRERKNARVTFSSRKRSRRKDRTLAVEAGSPINSASLNACAPHQLLLIMERAKQLAEPAARQCHHKLR